MAGAEIERRSEPDPEEALRAIVGAFAELGRLFETFAEDVKVAVAEIAGVPAPVRKVKSERVDE